MRFKTLAALLALSIWPGVAHAAWLEASSDHFVIYADDGEKDITRFARQLESYHAAMALAVNSIKPAPSPSNRVTVYVVRNGQAVRQLYGENSKNIGGFYLPRAGGSLAIVPAVQAGNGPVTWSMIVLLHEYAHHFLMSSAGMSMPRWFNEGAAEFFASSAFEADGSVWIGRAAQHRAGDLFLAKDVKVADLLDPTEYEKRRHDSLDAFYGKSWLLYHYLTFEPSRSGQLGRYIDLLQSGKSQRDAALAAFGDFGVLEKDVGKYLLRTRLAALKLAPGKLQIGTVAIRALRPGEAAAMPVRIRSKRGIRSREEADAALADGRAVAVSYPDDPAVLAVLAECEYDAGHDKEAITAADGALQRDPAQVNAYVQKGLALFRLAAESDDKAAAYRRARAPFVALNKLENDHPLPLLYYYLSYARQGQEPPPIALDGLIRAVELAPFDQGLRMTLGVKLVQLGRRDDARVILGPVANDPHDSGLSGAARRIIQRMDADPSWKGEGIKALSEDLEANDE